MYLFSRRRTLNSARARQGVAVALEAGRRATGICGLDISVWTTVMGPGIGTVGWSAMVENLTDIEMAMDKLNVDGAFNDFVEENDGLFTGSIDDTVAQILTGAPAPGATPPGYAQVGRATCAPGHIGEAMAFGVEATETAARISGLSSMFLATASGVYGGVMWVFGAPDLASLEAGNARLNSDPSFNALVDKIGPAFLAGASVNISRRIS
jgi:hypothetical protein